jgi:hypothetical protein
MPNHGNHRSPFVQGYCNTKFLGHHWHRYVGLCNKIRSYISFYLRTHQCELRNVTIFYLCVGFLQDLDLQCEELIKEEFGAECNFDVHDAVKKLEKLGIIHRVNLSTNSFWSKYLARPSLYRSRQLKFGSSWIVLGCWNLFLCVVTCVAVKTFSSYKSTYLGCISQLSLLPIFFLSCSAFRTKWE